MSRLFTTPKGSTLQIITLKGKEYLEVKNRLIWFREEHPEWGIETKFVTLSDHFAMARATVKDEKGRIIATAHKAEDQKGFFDFAEKAETGAIGRALALIGYGTQFTADELDEGERIVDSPVQPLKGHPGVSPVRPEQPAPGDGIQHDGYHCPGHLDPRIANKAISRCHPAVLREVVVNIEASYQGSKRGIPAKAQEFIKEAEKVIGRWENDPASFSEEASTA